MTLLHITPQDEGWVLQMSPEMARAAGVAENSSIVFYLSDGTVAAEILPPATTEMKESVRRFVERNAGFLEEMKRLGD